MSEKERITIDKSDKVQIYPVVHVYNDDGTNEDMLKCPCCGSSEEVRLLSDPAQDFCNEDGSPLSMEQISKVFWNPEYKVHLAWCTQCSTHFNPYNHSERF